MSTHHGTVIGMQQHIIEVEFKENFPEIHHLLTSPADKEVQLEVISSASSSSVYCLVLNLGKGIRKGTEVINTFHTLSVPVGESILGRTIDIFGQSQDGNPLLTQKSQSLYYDSSPELENTILSNEVIETGIKAIDFFAPVLKGGKVGLFGGAGLGKTVLLTELINNIVIRGASEATGKPKTRVSSKDRVSVFSAVGERSREVLELQQNLADANVLHKTALVVGQMGENPAVRFHTALAAVTLAENFRDQEHKDVLFFMDNIYRFAQAGYELATQMNAIPSEDGYQPNLESQVGQLHERLCSTTKGSITAIEAVYLPSDNMNDYAVKVIIPYLDSQVVLSRLSYQQGIFPAMDLLSSNSIALTADIVGEEHYSVYLQAKKLLEQAVSIERLVSLVGLEELSLDDQKIYIRSQLIKNYMTQNFFSIEAQNGQPGIFVSRTEVVKDVAEILTGKHDSTDAEKLLFIGALSDHK